MLKIPSKVSIMLSITISIVLLVVCLVVAFFLPAIADMLLEARNYIGTEKIGERGLEIVLAFAYLALAIVVFADCLLMRLLFLVNRGKVFTNKSVGYIRGVSWCCFALCLPFFALGFFFNLAFFLVLIVIFLGLCLRVVKNVIEEATIIKSENDLTV